MVEPRKTLGHEAENRTMGRPASGFGEDWRIADNQGSRRARQGGAAIEDQDAALKGVKGIVVFDGTWAQAKTLWWRNAWVLKARRLVLNRSGARSTAICGANRAKETCRRSRRSGSPCRRSNANRRSGPTCAHHSKRC